MDTTITKVLIVFSLISVLLCLFILVDPALFGKENIQLSQASNVISLFSAILAVIALFVASLAYIAAIQRPKLELIIQPWMGNAGDVALHYIKESSTVTQTRPFSSWKIYLSNTGKATARYPLVEIKFIGAYFLENDFPGWKAVHHANALGWYGFQWNPEQRLVVHPGFPVELPSMYLGGRKINQKLEIIVTVVADGYTRRTIKIPVRLEEVCG